MSSNSINAKPLKILMIIDDAQDELWMREALSDFPQNFEIVTIDGSLNTLQFLDNLDLSKSSTDPKLDLILLNLYIKTLANLDTLKAIESKATAYDIPLLIMERNSKHNKNHAYSLYVSSLIRKSLSHNAFKNLLHRAMLYHIDLQ
jgi:hypothetical protein